jgi:hypothetical protein
MEMRYIIINYNGHYWYHNSDSRFPPFGFWLAPEIYSKGVATKYELKEAQAKAKELSKANDFYISILALTGSEEEMLPMNKIVEDIAEFVKNREAEVMGTPVGHEDVQEQRDEVVLFANELSEKYEELVSVELIDTLMVSYQDSMDKLKDDTANEG